MDQIDLGAAILERLGYIGDGVQKFRHGNIMFSLEPFGFLYDLTDEMKAVVDNLKVKGYGVYAVIYGKYVLDGGSSMYATSYLCVQ